MYKDGVLQELWNSTGVNGDFKTELKNNKQGVIDFLRRTLPKEKITSHKKPIRVKLEEDQYPPPVEVISMTTETPSGHVPDLPKLETSTDEVEVGSLSGIVSSTVREPSFIDWNQIVELEESIVTATSI